MARGTTQKERVLDAPINEGRVSRRVLTHLLSEFSKARTERDAAEARMARFGETLDLLIQRLPASEQPEFRSRFERLRVGPVQRGGEVHGNVIALFRRDQRLEWTVPDIQQALAQNGTAADPKAVHNAVNYLASTGRLQRIARGRYVVTGLGVGLDTAEEIGGADHGTSWTTEHDV